VSFTLNFDSFPVISQIFNPYTSHSCGIGLHFGGEKVSFTLKFGSSPVISRIFNPKGLPFLWNWASFCFLNMLRWVKSNLFDLVGTLSSGYF
jgi:hypothetical protein